MIDNTGKYEVWVDTRQRKRKYNDLSGLTFGRLTVLYRSTDEIMSNNNTTPRYACKCECGDEILVRSTALKSGHTSSCSRCNRRESLVGKNLENLTGQKFHRWTVIRRAESVLEPRGKLATVWKCRCDCGVERDVRASSLKGNLTYSCGCYKHEQLSVKRDLVGQTFGLWDVLEKSDELFISPTNGRWYYTWLCKCECGTIRNVVEQALISNKSASCGCTMEPSLEAFTREYLDESDISFSRQKTFHDLRGVGNGLLSYDFAIYDEFENIICLIECQGKQHFEPSEFFGGEPQFQVQLEHDRLKRKKAHDLKIPLLEVDYRSKTYKSVFVIIDDFLKSIV